MPKIEIPGGKFRITPIVENSGGNSPLEKEREGKSGNSHFI
jgi:hypothetical protein